MYKIDPSKLPFPIIEDGLINFNNYGVYSELVTKGVMSIDTRNFNKSNIDNDFFCILNILRDGIEQDRVHNMIVNVTFADNVTLKLSIFDYILNVIMWKMPVEAGDPITSNFLFYYDCTTQNSIKSYIDEKLINVHRTDLENTIINNIIDDTLYKIGFLDEFSEYLANTINEEDTIELMKADPEAREIIHLDLTGVPIEKVRNVGMEATNRLIKKISAPNSKHCLRDSFRAQEAINPKQFKEFVVNIGTKPDGRGGIFTHIINSSFAVDGVKDPEDYFIESANGRQAQIIQKQNVGTSGSFSRKIGLNNMDTKIHSDPNYSCNTKNLVPQFITDGQYLDLFKNRWYAMVPGGYERQLSYKPSKYNSDLIGKTIYLRSPITCASHARGDGICYKCYGALAHTNNNINVGKMASEILSAQLTQRLLSAKHLLETRAKTITWSPMFDTIFELSVDSIRIHDDFKVKKWKMIIDADEYDDNDNEDDMEYNTSITGFEVESPTGDIYPIHTNNMDPLFLSREFDELVRSKSAIEGKYIIDFTDIASILLFKIIISNNELSETLNMIKSILDKSSVTKGKTIEETLSMLLSTIITGGIHIDSVHTEVILSNQVRRLDDKCEENILLSPEWEYPNEPYQVITLDRALKDNPSITISLNYNKVKKILIRPLSFKKSSPSCVDLFFMENPQDFMNKEIDDNPKFKEDHDKLIRPVYFVDKEAKKLKV